MPRPLALALALTIVALPWAAPASAQEGSAQAERVPSVVELVEHDPFGDEAGGEGSDPLGLSVGDSVEGVRALDPEREVHRRIPPRHGEILTAIPGVRETQHELRASFAEGLALVEHELRFESSSRSPAEVAYRLSVPEGSTLVSLRVCNDAGCRDGVEDPSEGNLGVYDDAARARGGAEAAADRPRRPLPG